MSNECIRCPFCSSSQQTSARFCADCGARLAGPSEHEEATELATRMQCPSCGHLTQPLPYFARGANIAKLVALLPVSHVVGPLALFFLRKDRFICRDCHALLPICAASVSILDAFSSQTSAYLTGGPYEEPVVMDEGMVRIDEETRSLDARAARHRRTAWIAALGSLACVSALCFEQRYPTALLLSGSGVLALLSALAAVRGRRISHAADALWRRLQTMAIRSLARKHGDLLDVDTVVAAFRIDGHEAERLLDAMAAADEAELQVDDEGRLSYRFRS